MWLRISLPIFAEDGAAARIRQIHLAEGARIAPGDALADIFVDLSGGVLRDCPPISICRIIIQEAAWLRRLTVAPGAAVAQSAVIALLSTDADSSWEEPVREARVTTAAILRHADWWTSDA